MNAHYGELIGWILSLTLLAAVGTVLVFQIRRRPTKADDLPWREIMAVILAFWVLLLLAFLFPFAGRVIFTDPTSPSLLLPDVHRRPIP